MKNEDDKIIAQARELGDSMIDHVLRRMHEMDMTTSTEKAAAAVLVLKKMQQIKNFREVEIVSLALVAALARMHDDQLEYDEQQRSV